MRHYRVKEGDGPKGGGELFPTLASRGLEQCVGRLVEPGNVSGTIQLQTLPVACTY